MLLLILFNLIISTCVYTAFIYPICLFNHVTIIHLTKQRHPSIILKSSAKLLSMSFHVKTLFHCWATYQLWLSDAWAKALNVNSSTWCATACATLPFTVVCLLSEEPESLWHLNLPITTAVCCCVCMSLGVTHCLCFGLLCDSDNINYVTAVRCCVYAIWCN